MRDKNGCLNCHFLAVDLITREGIERIPLEKEFRNPDSLLKLIQKDTVKCDNGYWDLNRISTKNIPEIKNVILRADRGKKCTHFDIYDCHATLEAIRKRNKIKVEVIDRKKTRRLAWVAIIISAFATLLAAILPFLFT